TNWAIQRAIDAAHAAGGGTVELPAGEYAMHSALLMRTGVSLVGEPGAILKRVPSVSVPVRDFLGFGFYEITVTEPDKLQVGQTIYIDDENAPGFYATVATIV